MIEDLFASIKGERQLSFSHWRYRLLHFSAGINPKTVKESYLPNFLYTHYCPLFHLTNLLALFLPFIIILRCSILFGKLIYAVISFVLDFVNRWLPKPPPMTDEEYEKRVRELLRNNEFKVVFKYLLEFEDFTTFWDSLGSGVLRYISEEEARQYWETHRPEALRRKELKDKRRKKAQAWAVFWVNFSRFIVKWVLNILYVAVAIAATYFVFFIMIPGLWDMMMWSTGNIWFILSVMGWILLGFGTVAALIGGTVVLGVKGHLDWMHEKDLRDVQPFKLMWDICGAFFGYVGSSMAAFIEFAAMFYEENCPPVKIVGQDIPSEEDE